MDEWPWILELAQLAVMGGGVWFAGRWTTALEGEVARVERLLETEVARVEALVTYLEDRTGTRIDHVDKQRRLGAKKRREVSDGVDKLRERLDGAEALLIRLMERLSSQDGGGDSGPGD